MSKRYPAGMIFASLALLVSAFWAGRASVPGMDPETRRESRLPTRYSDRSASRGSARSAGPGAGDQAVTSALQLRDIFKHSGGNMPLGSAMADAALARMNAPEIARLVQDLAHAQAASPGYAFTLEINAACARWAEVDPKAALRFVLANRQASFRSAALGSIFAGMAKLDPALARAELAALDDPAMRQSAQSSLLAALTVASPDEWVAAILDDPSLGQQYGLSSIVSEWAIDDPAKAAERLARLPAEMRSNGVASLAKVWGSKDASAARAWALSLGEAKQRNLALGAVAGGLAAHDPDAALASLDELDPSARRSGMRVVFATLVDLDFDLALEKASALSDPSDRGAAMDLLAGNEYGSGDDPFASSGSYSARSPDQLMKLLAELPAGKSRSAALNTLGGQLASASPGEAENILANYSDEERAVLQSRMLQQLTYNHPERALEVYQSLPPGQVDTSTFSQILDNLASKDPDTVLELALASESGDVRTNGVARAFSHLAARDPQAASSRLDSLATGSGEYQSALRSVAAAWVRQDPDAANAWAARLDPESRVMAFNTLIPAMTESDPSTAFGWAANLADQEQRAHHMERVANQWIGMDRAQASEAIQQADLPAEVRERLMRKLE